MGCCPVLGKQVTRPPTKEGASLAALPLTSLQGIARQMGRACVKMHQAHEAAPVLNHAASPWSLHRQEKQGRETKSQTLRHVFCRTGGPRKSPRAGLVLMGRWGAGSRGSTAWMSPPRRWLCRFSQQHATEHPTSGKAGTEPLTAIIPLTRALFPELKSRIIMRLGIKFHKKSS